MLGRADEADGDDDERPLLELGGRTDVGGRLVAPLEPARGPGWDGEVRGTMIGREPDGLPGDVTGAREPVDRGVSPSVLPMLVPLVTPGVTGVDGRERVTNGLR